MPEISRFFGIIIRMFIDDHAPPHFHAFYQNFQASIEIETGLMKAQLPPRVIGFVQEWRTLHREELLGCWKQGIICGVFSKIEPLE